MATLSLDCTGTFGAMAVGTGVAAGVAVGINRWRVGVAGMAVGAGVAGMAVGLGVAGIAVGAGVAGIAVGAGVAGMAVGAGVGCGAGVEGAAVGAGSSVSSSPQATIIAVAKRAATSIRRILVDGGILIEVASLRSLNRLNSSGVGHYGYWVERNG